MLRYKHMRLDQEKIDRVQKILGARTETEALHQALEKVILEDRRRNHRLKVVRQLLDLRSELGKIREDSSEWVRRGRKERLRSHEIGR